MVPLLEQRGALVHALDLPGTGVGPPSGLDLSADAAAVRAAIEALPGDGLVCGHSYGGRVIFHPAVATHPRVAHLAYRCAFMPQARTVALCHRRRPAARLGSESMSAG